MSDFNDDQHSTDVDTISAPLCEALTKVRQIRGHTLDVAAVGIGMTPRDLRDLESGSSHPDPATIERMAAFYGIDADRLGTDVMIQRTAPTVDPVACVIWFGWLPIAYDSNDATNASILESVADGIRLLRSSDPTAAVVMRESELDLVMTLLDLDDEDLVVDAVRALRLPWKHTEQLISASRERISAKSLIQDDRGLLRLEGDD